MQKENLKLLPAAQSSAEKGFEMGLKNLRVLCLTLCNEWYSVALGPSKVPKQFGWMATSNGDVPPAIARGTSCPGHVVVPWAHSPIWSRQDPNFVSLIQIASYKR